MQIGGGGATKTVRVDERRKGVALGREEAREGKKWQRYAISVPSERKDSYQDTSMIEEARYKRSYIPILKDFRKEYF